MTLQRASLIALVVLLCLTANAGASLTKSIMAAEPVAYWQLGQPAECRVFDLASYDYATGAPVKTTGNGTKQVGGMSAADALYASISRNAGDLASTGDLTIALWAKPASLASEQVLLTYAGAGNKPQDNILYELALAPGGEVAYRHHDKGHSVYSHTFKGAALAANEWQFLVLVRDTGLQQVKLYVNDGWADAGAFKHNPFNGKKSSLHIGADPWGKRTFNGSLDQIAIFNYAFSNDQVASLALAAVGGEVPEPCTLILLALGAIIHLRIR